MNVSVSHINFINLLNLVLFDVDTNQDRQDTTWACMHYVWENLPNIMSLNECCYLESCLSVFSIF